MCFNTEAIDRKFGYHTKYSVVANYGDGEYIGDREKFCDELMSFMAAYNYIRDLIYRHYDEQGTIKERNEALSELWQRGGWGWDVHAWYITEFPFRGRRRGKNNRNSRT